MPYEAEMGRIAALVLTYNRKELLRDCLLALLAQSEPPSEILVLDNGSTDGTRDYLLTSGWLESGRVAAFTLDRNVGPAAGFDTLFRLAFARGNDWLWCLEDDIVAAPDALRELKTAFAENFSGPEELGFLQSVAVARDGSPSNVPDVDLRAQPGRCPSWTDRLNGGLVKMRWATLNSVLLPRTTLLRIGGLSPDFYFAGEDIDFTLRVTAVLPAYLVGRSKVVHLHAVGDVFSELNQRDLARVRMGFFYYRNNVYLRRRHFARRSLVAFWARCGWETSLAFGARTYPLRRVQAILGGALAGLFFAPAYPPLNVPPAVAPVPLSARHNADQPVRSTSPNA